MTSVKYLFLFFIGCVAASATACAQIAPSGNQLFVEASVGGMFNVTPAQKITPWLSLNDYRKNDICLTIGAKYFWSKAWGVQIQMLLNPSASTDYLYDGKLLDNNLVEVSRGKVSGSSSIGLVYRYGSGRWNVQPYFNVGITGFSNTGFSTYIEHTGTNDVDLFVLKMEKNNRIGFSMLPGVQVAYNLKKRLFLYAEVSYVINQASSKGEYTLRNLYTQEVKEQQCIKDKYTDALQMKLGVSVKLF